MKEGFIYIWFDRKRKMYYIGCHWGTIDDGYICSSNRMRDAYRRRPQDFKRKILQSKINKEQLLIEEHKWLSKIQDSELGIKYYNLRNHMWGHWSQDETRSLQVKDKLKGNKNRLGDHKSHEERQKISKALTGRKRSPESIEKQRLALLGRNQTPEHIAKKNASNTGKKREGQALINMQRVAQQMGKSNKGRHLDEEHRKKLCVAQKKRYGVV